MRKTSLTILGLLTALLPGHALAYVIPINFCTFGLGLSAACIGGGALGLNAYVATTFVQVIGVGFMAVAVAMFFYFAASLIAGSNDESAITESKIGYAHAITGGAIVSMAAYIVVAFTPSAGGPGANLVNTAPLNQAFNNVILYFKLILGGASAANVTIQAVRMILAQSQEDATKAKTRLLYGFIGIAIILLANAIVRAAFVPEGANSGIIGSEIAGIVNFLLSAFAFVCVLAVIIAGIFLIISIDESLKEKAKTIIKTAVIALAVILSAYSIVNAFITL